MNSPHKRESSLAQGLSFNAVASMMVLGLNTISGVLVARILGPEGRGDLAASVGVVLFLGWFCLFGLRDAVAFLGGREKVVGRDEAYFWSALTCLLPLAAAVAFGIWFWIPWALGDQGSNVVFLARCGLPLLFFVPLMELARGIASVQHRDHLIPATGLITQVVYVAALIVLLVSSHNQVETLLLVGLLQVCTIGAGAVVCLFVVMRRAAPPQFGVQNSIDLLKFGGRAWIGSLGQLATARLDLFVLPLLTSGADLGRYAIASNFSYVVVAISANFGSMIVARTGFAELANFAKIHALSFWVSVTMASGLAVTAPLLIPALYGADFGLALYYLEILLPGAVLWASTTILCSGIVSMGRPGLVSIIQGLGGLLSALLLLVLVPAHGVVGAAWASLFSYSAVWLATLFAFRRLARDLAPGLFSGRVLLVTVRWGFAKVYK